MTAPDAGSINLILAVNVHAASDADSLDREAEELERQANTKRMEAFRLRALARAVSDVA